MADLVRKYPRFFLASLLTALALRLFFIFCFPGVVDDSRLYANIAENWLQHGVYGITNSGQIMPTLSRLPGYPAFLAAIFFLFRDENFRAVLFVQALVDLGTCFLIADLARRLLSERAAKTAFLLTAICPFLANYAAAALTETLEIFFTTLALDLAVVGLESIASAQETKLSPTRIWLFSGLSIGTAILLRPDGGILLAAVGAFLVYLLTRSLLRKPGMAHPSRIIVAGLLLAAGAVAPLLPWTIRNLHSLHRFEPLAPRYANDSDETVMAGFNRWTKTWMADYVSVQEIYWNVPGDTLDITKLPNRAFDSPAQGAETASLFADYNRDHDISPELDARFAALAAARIHSAPLRYYVWLPVVRVLDMWLRPRTELLPPDPRWWEFNDNRLPLATSFAFGFFNLIYVAAAALGLIKLLRRLCPGVRFAERTPDLKPAPEVEIQHRFFSIVLFLLFLVLRSAFLGTLENPEPRYTLECYPIVILLCSACFS